MAPGIHSKTEREKPWLNKINPITKNYPLTFIWLLGHTPTITHRNTPNQHIEPHGNNNNDDDDDGKCIMQTYIIM